MAETVEEKALRLIREGRLTIQRVDRDEGWVVAHCRGDTGGYALGWDPIVGQFRCTCPEMKGQCSHLYALKLVVERT